MERYLHYFSTLNLYSVKTPFSEVIYIIYIKLKLKRKLIIKWFVKIFNTEKKTWYLLIT